MNSKRTSLSQGKQVPQLKPKIKSKEESIQVLLTRLGALVKGFKIRRILRNHKTVVQLKKEYSDMMKFAYELK